MGIGERVFRLLGEQSARDNLASTHRAFVDARDPHGLLQHAAAILRSFDCLSYSRAECLGNMGWHQAAIAVCGGLRPRVTDPLCRARGDAHCEYLCEWE